MEIAIKEASTVTGSKTRNGQTMKLAETAIWFDTTGVGWDKTYIARFEALRAILQGVLICAWDTQYDEARAIWTGKTNCWPAAMAQCMNKSDARSSVAFAQKHGLTVITRSNVSKEAIISGSLIMDLSWV